MILIVAPNFGRHFGIGGGVKVAVVMAESLLELGYDVMLVGLKGFDTVSLDRLYDTHLDSYKKDGNLKVSYMLGEGSQPPLPFPIAVKLLTFHLKKLLKSNFIEKIIFHDDVPKFSLSKEIPLTLYSHFPYAARIAFNCRDPIEAHTRAPLSAQIKSLFMASLNKTLLPRMIHLKEKPRGVLIANSTVTKEFMEDLWKAEVPVLYPPVTTATGCYDKGKADLIVSVGTIQPNKRFGDVLNAVRFSRNGKLVIIGFRGPSWYQHWLKARINRMGLEKRVTILQNIEEEKKWDILSRSKIIVHAAHFEPFGISVVEGMSSGCVPIVFKSRFSGPYVDILEKGKFGFTFTSVRELSDKINMLLEDRVLWKNSSKIAAERARCFDVSSFKTKFVDLIDCSRREIE